MTYEIDKFPDRDEWMVRVNGKAKFFASSFGQALDFLEAYERMNQIMGSGQGALFPPEVETR